MIKRRYVTVGVGSIPECEPPKLEAGIIYAPYIYQERDESDTSSIEYDRFMEEYHKKHERCPKCGGKGHSVTLMGYILNMDDKESYKDNNRCTCSHCGNIHKTHDRVPYDSRRIPETKTCDCCGETHPVMQDNNGQI